MATNTTMNQNERFFRYFRLEVTALTEQIHRLADTALAGGERADATDHCLAAIERLSNEVKDASAYIPAHDQRTYIEAVKGLNEELQEMRSTYAPKPKFAFKSTRKNASAISLSDAEALASEQRLQMAGYDSQATSASASIPASPKERPRDPINRESGMSASQIRKPSFSHSSTITLSSMNDTHIILPPSAAHATASGSLSQLRRCVIDMSAPTTLAPHQQQNDEQSPGRPFAALTLKNIKSSLLVCGAVKGALHATALSKCILVARCAQFRLHDSDNVDVYLACSSRPIIENCSAIRFAPMPLELQGLGDPKTSESTAGETDGRWAEVDDFNWLHAGHSPNWSVLPESERLAGRVWTELVPGGPGHGLAEILKAVGIEK